MNLFNSLRGVRRWIVAKKMARQWTGHDQTMSDFYSQFISPGDLCFDVGANIGNRVKIFLKLKARVIAIEPQLECIKTLKNAYSGNRNFQIVKKALGESEGTVEMMISNVNTISSLSKEWIKAVKDSGRFAAYDWNKTELVEMTTLDRLIDEYGTPAFVKIDVEGFEYSVIKGLSKPLVALSLEYTPEFSESTFDSIRHLRKLGKIILNYSLGESMQLELNSWIGPEEMIAELSSFKNSTKVFGDVYIRFVEGFQKKTG